MMREQLCRCFGHQGCLVSTLYKTENSKKALHMPGDWLARQQKENFCWKFYSVHCTHSNRLKRRLGHLIYDQSTGSMGARNSPM